MNRVSVWLIDLVWKCASTALALRFGKRGERGLAGQNDPPWLRRLWRGFCAWMLEPVPFPRDHWYEDDRQRLARRRDPMDKVLGVAAAVSLALGAKSLAAEDAVSTTLTRQHAGRVAWHYQETASFRIWAPSRPATDHLAANCETLRSNLRRTWLSNEADEAWSAKCIVVVHGDLKSYRRAIGDARDRSVGLATYEVKQRRIVGRRIDLRSDAERWWADALPHELTHVLLADAFGGRAVPAWVGEGLAVLSESHRKQDQRALEVRRAAAAGMIMPTTRLLALEGPPAAQDRDVFYGQSALLVSWLIQRRGRERFLKFVESNRENGPNAALLEVYGVAAAGRLDELWSIGNSTAHNCGEATRSFDAPTAKEVTRLALCRRWPGHRRYNPNHGLPSR